MAALAGGANINCQDGVSVLWWYLFICYLIFVVAIMIIFVCMIVNLSVGNEMIVWISDYIS